VLALGTPLKSVLHKKKEHTTPKKKKNWNSLHKKEGSVELEEEPGGAVKKGLASA